MQTQVTQSEDQPSMHQQRGNAGIRREIGNMRGLVPQHPCAAHAHAIMHTVMHPSPSARLYPSRSKYKLERERYCGYTEGSIHTQGDPS
eukprot:2817750-Prymnesium_polylepis.1